ncbi:sigma-54 interaction domain-containing protein [Thermovenabulum gondwanense]|uniref:Arginine utilization regulatory protein RocR n=1 Tax=Thermovenabulum gondwanense TaxID=520767 RepID=A0A161QD88_9FIRM|nr:sigma-54-dependent Fis family transcriptional regulator [Thermovenabulum gondwanense]KYO67793.1 Arginine utilization regulatory protein RocR [Thermovenabulum gondwanense]
MVSPEILRAIFDAINEGILVVDTNENIIMINNAAAKLIGVEKKDAEGKNVVKILPNTRLPVVLRTKNPELNQIQKLKDTTIITSRMPIFDEKGDIKGAVAIFRDISEVKNLAEELTNLKEIRTLLEAIINSTQDAISVVDSEGKGILINKAYTNLVGLTKEDIIGKPATVDIAEGESVHYKVLKTRMPIKGVPMKVGPNKKEVIVHAAPIIVNDQLKGSVAVIHDVSEIKRLTEELDLTKRKLRHLEAKYTFDDIIGESPVIVEAKEAARSVALTNATILLRGESGTGKELFAHAIHNSSYRKHSQFVRVNCAALTDSLLGSELFGYAEGAFTGAKKGGRKGLFEEADGGTIFLDEISEIGLSHQAMLLRVLNEKEILRVGESKPVPVNVRVIAATNVNLERAVEEGRFRKDLYFRLNVFPIYIPPLRERKEDIPLLVEHFIKKYNQEYGRAVESIEKSALKSLMDYDWPGNIRELENVISRAIINMKTGESIIEKKHLPSFVGGYFEEKLRIVNSENLNLPLKSLIEETEKEAIISVLNKTGGNKHEAARILGISIRNLFYKIKKYGL